MDYAMRLVYETEGRHGGDIRGWHGEQARREAEEFERQIEELKWRAEHGPPLSDQALEAMASRIIGEDSDGR